MFEATLSDPVLLRDSIDAIAELITEGIFKISGEGISLIAADRAVVAVVSWHLGAKAFKSYKCDEEHKIGINIQNLLRILRRSKAGDKITLSLEEGEKLGVSIVGESQRKFSVPLLELRESEIPNIEELKFSMGLKLKSSIIEDAIADAELVADAISFYADEKSLKLSASGDGSKVEIVVDRKSISDFHVEGQVRSVYSLEYLRKMMKASRLAEHVTIRFGQDFPMKLEFKKPDKLSLGFVLAPRVEE